MRALTLLTSLAALGSGSRGATPQTPASQPFVPEGPPAFFTDLEKATWYQMNQAPETLSPFAGAVLQSPSDSSEHLSTTARIAAEFAATTAGQLNEANKCAADLQPRATPTNPVIAEFLAANPDVTTQDLEAIRNVTRGITVLPIVRVRTPEAAEQLRHAVIEPAIRFIQNSPDKSTFENEEVVRITRATKEQPFSNYMMHLRAGGQNGVHAHPHGARNLEVNCDGPWELRCCAPGDTENVVVVRCDPGRWIVNLPANRTHGFEAIIQPDGTEVNCTALSVHRNDLGEFDLLGVPDTDDAMANLTRGYGSDRIMKIANRPIPVDVVRALHA